METLFVVLEVVILVFLLALLYLVFRILKYKQHIKEFLDGITMNLYVHITDDEKEKEVKGIEKSLKVM